MSVEDIELRHLVPRKLPPLPAGQIDHRAMPQLPVLQYRTKVKEACRVEYRSGGNIYTRDGFRDVWTEWQDVPVVEET
jgi:hypothetical protein